MNPKITVFTPSYNRAKLLPRVYRSLCRQTLKDFEWLIVDDGSKDDTQAVVEGWKDAPFPIRYVYKDNGGLHTAINRGIQEARTEYWIWLDSDDWFADNTLERAMAVWDTIADKSQFAEVLGLTAYEGGEVVGTRFPRDMLDTDAAELMAIHKVWGDKYSCRRTEVYRAFPFPEDLGRYVVDSLVWFRVARQYKSRCVNEVWAYKEFQEGGITDRIVHLRASSPKATLTYYAETVELFMQRSYPLSLILRNSVQYVRFGLHGGWSPRQQLALFPSAPLWFAALLPGAAAYIADKYFGGLRRSQVKIARPKTQTPQSPTR